MSSERNLDDNYDEEKFGNFKWLRRAARGPTFKSYSRFARLSASSFDWGAEGLAGSSNHGGELLALSKFSPSRGLVQAQGSFSTSLYASLSRMQIDFGGPATFGLEIARTEHTYYPQGGEAGLQGSSFTLGTMIERGSFNHRWPFNEYYLDLHEELNINGSDMQGENHIQGRHVGTCQMFSFAQDGMFYQILRIEEGSVGDQDSHSQYKFPDESQVVLTMGGPVWFRSFDEDNLRDKDLAQSRMKSTSDVSIPAGDSDNQRTTIRLWDRSRGIGLEARIHALYSGEPGQLTHKQLKMSTSKAAVDSGPQEALVQDKTNNILAYNAVFPLSDVTKNVSSHPRSVTFLAEIRFFEDPQSNSEDSNHVPPSSFWPPLPKSKNIFDYVGVSSSSEQATGAMWDTIFIDRLMKSDKDMDLDEVNLIGRALEKILQIELVPAFFTTLDKRQDRQEVAIVSNLFVRPNVDLEAIFWKIRFLVRAYKFLSRLRDTNQNTAGQHGLEKVRTHGNKSTPTDVVLHLSWSSTEQRVMVKIANAQMLRIKTSIKSVVQFLVQALLKPGLTTKLMPYGNVLIESDYYYVTTTIWYVVRNFSGWKWDWKDQMETWKGAGALWKRLPPKNWTFDSAETDKVSLLQWFHYGSLLGLCQEKLVPENWEGRKGLEEMVFKLGKAAKISAAAKFSSRQPYEAEDEIIDRLSFLSIELGLEPREYGRINTVASFVVKRVKARDHTRVLNSGWLSLADKGSTSGPWEIHALCHHSRLVVLSLEDVDPQDWRLREHKNEEIDILKRRIYLFQNTEGTLVPSWERAHAKVRDGWLHSEATAVLASTLLMMNEQDMKDGLLNTGAMDIDTRRGSVDGFRAELARPPPLGDQVHQNQRRLPSEFLHMESLVKDEIKVMEKFTGEVGHLAPVDWTTFSLPRRYHPVSFFNSLESTPDIYTAERLKTATLPSPLRSVISLPELEFSYTSLSQQNLENLNVSDITATGPDQDHEGFTWEISKFYKTDPKLDALSKRIDELSKPELATLKERNSLVSQKNEIIGQKQQYLCWRLYGSLVDQEVQHRFLTVKELRDPKDSKDTREAVAWQSLTNLLVFVIHPESAPGLGNHILRSSRFACQRGETWVASITLRSWRMNPTILPKSDRLRTFKDDEPIFFPDYVEMSVWENAPQSELVEDFKNMCFELDVSSMVISTNAFGDFSKCTLVSKLINEVEMDDVVKDARKLWQKFIHQPQTGRCLVFFLVLGKMCQLIVDDYTKAIETLTSILETHYRAYHAKKQQSNRSFRKELSTSKSGKERSDDKPGKDQFDDNLGPLGFELIHWRMDSLLKLQYSLKATVNTIVEAKDDLMGQIQDGPGKRSVVLEKMCQEKLADFESSLLQLAVLNLDLERSIKLNTRYEASLEVVSERKDRLTALDQNDHIRKLTYLTIIYLPITLMASIYAIPGEHHVLLDAMGLGWFLGSIFLVSAATYILAIYIGDILKILVFLVGPLFGKKKSKEGSGIEHRVYAEFKTVPNHLV